MKGRAKGGNATPKAIAQPIIRPSTDYLRRIASRDYEAEKDDREADRKREAEERIRLREEGETPDLGKADRYVKAVSSSNAKAPPVNRWTDKENGRGAHAPQGAAGNGWEKYKPLTIIKGPTAAGADAWNDWKQNPWKAEEKRTNGWYATASRAVERAPSSPTGSDGWRTGAWNSVNVAPTIARAKSQEPTRLASTSQPGPDSWKNYTGTATADPYHAQQAAASSDGWNDWGNDWRARWQTSEGSSDTGPHLPKPSDDSFHQPGWQSRPSDSAEIFGAAPKAPTTHPADMQAAPSRADMLLKNKNLGDGGIRLHCEHLAEQLHKGTMQPYADMVDVTGNALTDAGLEGLINFVTASKLDIRHLRISENQLRDPMCLVRFCASEVAPRELGFAAENVSCECLWRLFEARHRAFRSTKLRPIVLLFIGADDAKLAEKKPVITEAKKRGCLICDQLGEGQQEDPTGFDIVIRRVQSFDGQGFQFQ